ncbi:hypothetical protein SEA_GALACTIC_78 [Mycobacterium phage Galactic]|uniref:Uncharacterized protein n=1 Tax=Mycobacterium phage Galactic TaxID=2301612 RepID=A0A385UC58_9CAUD|nr:hypothetical protein I5H41_gp078 [Mycobacterium phage Galactic]AYB69312.1 hypothetical protein SEA_GALACTIC_78 [Mycobacterium phage Galactic]
MNNQEKLARIREFCNSVPERDPGYEVARWLFVIRATGGEAWATR